MTYTVFIYIGAKLRQLKQLLQVYLFLSITQWSVLIPTGLKNNITKYRYKPLQIVGVLNIIFIQ